MSDNANGAVPPPNGAETPVFNHMSGDYPGSMQSQMYEQQNNSISSNSLDDESPFFADMTLDLATAHDIAETPEPHKHHVVMPHHGISNTAGLTMPKFAAGSSVHPAAGDLSALGNGPSHSRSFDGSHESGAGPSGGLLDQNATLEGTGSAEKSVAFADEIPPQTTRSYESSAGSLRSSASVDIGPMNSISSNGNHSSSRRMSSFSSGNRNQSSSIRSRYPRDVSWAVAFFVFVPLSLLIPAFAGVAPSVRSKSDLWMATKAAPRVATAHTLIWGYIATIVVARLMYRTSPGGDGDDARHTASQMLLVSAPVSAVVYFALTVGMFFFTPGAWYYAIIPIWYLVREIYLVRRWKRTASTPGGRQAFFQALTGMTLDLLSRSLRRLSFYRMVSTLLVVQMGVTYLWRAALLGALRSQRPILIFFALIGGKWATGTITRLLSLIASGGIASWFEQQQMGDSEMQEQGLSNAMRSYDSDEWDENAAGTEEIVFSDNPLSATAAPSSKITEAYRTADASEYKSVLAAEDDMDDDDMEDDDDSIVDRNPSYRNTHIYSNGANSPNTRVSNVKNLLFSGLTNSFGSVAQCGLLGGPAQFIWSQVRKVDQATETLRGFRGMNIGDASEQDTFSSQFWTKVNIWARTFVRCHSDLAMSHIAAYHKNYSRAAQDVATLVDESGVEPIIEDDISTHISACVGGSISGVIVLITGFILVQHRNINSPEISDVAVAQDMLLSFVLCYSLIFTVMEPLRAGIKAVYVSFAQHPQSLRQAFPIIFHRLQRMSESNLS